MGFDPIKRAGWHNVRRRVGEIGEIAGRPALEQAYQMGLEI